MSDDRGELEALRRTCQSLFGCLYAVRSGVQLLENWKESADQAIQGYKQAGHNVDWLIVEEAKARDAVEPDPLSILYECHQHKRRADRSSEKLTGCSSREPCSAESSMGSQ